MYKEASEIQIIIRARKLRWNLLFLLGWALCTALNMVIHHKKGFNGMCQHFGAVLTKLCLKLSSLPTFVNANILHLFVSTIVTHVVVEMILTHLTPR